MAEGLLKHITQDEYEIYNAGTKPSIVRPGAIKVLQEIGIDISKSRSKSVEEFTDRKIDFVLTVCDNAKENCPYFPAQTKLNHHSFADPARMDGDEETRIETFRKTRDQIHKYLKDEFCKILG